ncbi:bromodomain-containing protein 8 [Holotrichia oblita]|uniref:Bromodomain-containing protein 8 n=1 Tax=Holotrichia oblita TaxID=644536 RepID=A0ACB9TPE5_HOLOL|nr:bromodomain-containing protein 8 [Holotrichia oblita]
MTSIQERLQIKREPIDKWSTREQLCLASAVARSGDQNWMSVSRALKPFGDLTDGRLVSSENCAAQYGALLEHVETPKRKRGISEFTTVSEQCNWSRTSHCMQVIDQEPTTPELPDDAVDILPNLKVEDIESTLPEIKNEEVEGIISDLIENAEIVTDPEEHLALTDNIDLMDNLENELQELVKEEEEKCGKRMPKYDIKEEVVVEDSETTVETIEEIREVEDLKKECIGGSVEIVEVVAMEDEEIDKELNKSEIEDIVHSSKADLNVMKDLSNDEQQIVEVKIDKDSCDESNRNLLIWKRNQNLK